jgi:hypothetical protein
MGHSLKEDQLFNQCLSGNGAFDPISALGGEFESSKYSIYSSGSNPPSAMNAGAIHHFRMSNSYHPDDVAGSLMTTQRLPAQQ